MIHSLSGGVIRDNGILTFVKVEIDGAPYWYLSPFPAVKAGDVVLAPFGKRGEPRRAAVLKVEQTDAQRAPVPMNRIREIEGLI